MSLIMKNCIQFIYKGKSEAVTKLKLVRKSIIKNLRSIISFILELWLHGTIIVVITYIYGLCSKHWLQRKQQHGG